MVILLYICSRLSTIDWECGLACSGTILASAAQNQASAAAITQCESLFEEILGLPGLDGLDDEDLDAAFNEEMRNG